MNEPFDCTALKTKNFRTTAREREVQKVSGGHTGGATPDPIPNSEVKTSRADGTAGETLWESRSPPGLFEWKAPELKSSGAFSFSAPEIGLLELGQLAAEALRDHVLDAVIGAVDPLAGAADLAAVDLSLAQLAAEVILEAR